MDSDNSQTVLIKNYEKVSITNETQSNRLLHGQKFLTGVSSLNAESQIELNLIIREIIDNLSDFNILNTEETSLVNLIQENKEIPFPINPQESYQLFKIKHLTQKIKYLTHRFRLYRATTLRELVDVPPHLLIEPVSACNLRCPMCFQIDKSFTRKPYMGVMEFDLFKNLIDQADSLNIGAVTLASRGEPLMHPKIIDMLNYVASKKNIFELKINTNGMFMNEKIAEAILNAPVSIFVLSADHYKKEEYEELRKKSNYETIIKNMQMLNDKRIELDKTRSTEIRVSGIDFYKTLDKSLFTEFWHQYADNVSVGDAIERWDTYFNPTHPELVSPCNTIWNKMYVWFDGLCNPCDADYKSLLSYGDATKNTIKEIWTSEKVTKLRNDHLAGKRGCHNPCDRCTVDYG